MSVKNSVTSSGIEPASVECNSQQWLHWNSVSVGRFLIWVHLSLCDAHLALTIRCRSKRALPKWGITWGASAIESVPDKRKMSWRAMIGNGDSKQTTVYTTLSLLSFRNEGACSDAISILCVYVYLPLLIIESLSPNTVWKCSTTDHYNYNMADVRDT
jgi:hypothetical protein